MELKNCDQKIDNRLLFIFIIMIIALGGAIEVFNSHSLRFNNLWNLIIPVISIYYLYVVRIKLGSILPLIVALVIVLIWQIALYYKFDGYNVLAGRIYDVLFAFIIIRTLGIKKFFFYIETSVVKLTRISLFLWIIIVILPSIRDLLSLYSLPIYSVNTCGGTWGFWGFASKLREGEGVIIRNMGFAWEPGRFSSILVITFLIHLFRNRFMLFKKNFWVLLLGILSTQSTTGYLTFGVCLYGLFMNNNGKRYKKALSYGILGGFIGLFLLAPFMLDKIKYVFSEESFIQQGAANWFIEQGKVYVPQRWEGLYLEFMNIQDSPWIGYGDDKSYSYVRNVLFPKLDIRLSNGLLQIIAMMGIPLGLLLYFCLYKSSIYISNLYNVKGRLLIFIAVCTINISYNFFLEPIFMAITLYCLFIPKSDRIYIQSNRINSGRRFEC